MILFNFTVGFLSLFFVPYVVLNYYYFDKTKHSIIIAFSFLFSFSFAWIIFLIFFSLKLPNSILNLILYIIFIIGFYYIKKSRNLYIVGFSLSLMLLYPILLNIGIGFTQWDAVVSWNRWAIELYNNFYEPVNAAYPILFPSVWSILYKIQGTADIWWTSQLTLFLINILIVYILLQLFFETKKLKFIYILILTYPFLIAYDSISGYMDVPVMLFGLSGLIMILASEYYKEDKNIYIQYIVLALLFSGLSSIVKQSGIFFLLFTLIYVLFNLKYINNKKIIIIISLLSISYFISFLFLYLSVQHDIIGNISTLKSLSDNDKSLIVLWNEFNSFPNSSFAIKEYIIYVSLFLYCYKQHYKNIIINTYLLSFIIGYILWSVFFSYDIRNSIWINSFLIIFIAIIIDKLFKIKEIKYNLVAYKIHYSVIFILLGILFIGTINIKNKSLYNIQKSFQLKIGDPKLSLYMRKLLNGKDKCVKIATNVQLSKFNYNTKDIVNNIMIFGAIKPGMKYINHNCSEGRYFVLYKDNGDSRFKSDWNKINSLVKLGKIELIDNIKYMIYYIPPNMRKINE